MRNKILEVMGYTGSDSFELLVEKRKKRQDFLNLEDNLTNAALLNYFECKDNAPQKD